MQYPNITRLYKYCSYNENSLFILKNRKIRFSDPEEFNDPFDCRYQFKDEVDPVEFEQYGNRYNPQKMLELKNFVQNHKADNIYREIYENLLNQLAEDLKNTGVFCLSQLNNNILMWSHYSDHHNGFCIEFERNADNNLGKYAFPVRYIPFAYKRVTVFSSKAFEMKFSTKALDWRYEREWRLIDDMKNNPADLPGNITGIIFGLKMPDTHREAIKEILADLSQIKYFQAEEIPNNYRIKIIGL